MPASISPVSPCTGEGEAEAMEAARQYNVHEAKTHFSRILEQVANGEEVVISKAGEPVAKVVPLRRKVDRTDYGSLKGKIRIADDFDEMPEGWEEYFGGAGE